MCLPQVGGAFAVSGLRKSGFLWQALQNDRLKVVSCDRMFDIACSLLSRRFHNVLDRTSNNHATAVKVFS